MSRSARLILFVVASTLTLVLVILLMLGSRGARQAEQTRAKLTDQTAIATQLLSVQQAAEAEGETELAQAAEQALENLAPAARTPALDSVHPLPQQLNLSADALVQLGLDTQNPGDRARAFTALSDIWSTAQKSGITEDAYPATLIEELDRLAGTSCTAQTPTTQPVEALTALQENIHAMHYASTVYLARAQQGYEAVTEQAQQVAQEARELQTLTTPTLACAGQLQAASASYELVEPAEASEQLTQLSQGVRANALAALSEDGVSADATDLEVAALALALSVG
ncbi:hypothetical protein [Rothia nasisuis]|uniref:hypothetical protein n=1 Tax=Rothia nasisuis TaxID=2109647 RepID=UPI001F3BB211|nr:hypothetical protein [Rothia nasisuis]